MTTRPWKARLRHGMVYGHALPIALAVCAALVAGALFIRHYGVFAS